MFAVYVFDLVCLVVAVEELDQAVLLAIDHCPYDSSPFIVKFDVVSVKLAFLKPTTHQLFSLDNDDAFAVSFAVFVYLALVLVVSVVGPGGEFSIPRVRIVSRSGAKVGFLIGRIGLVETGGHALCMLFEIVINLHVVLHI